MAKPKSLCPTCCTHTITFTSDNCDFINEVKRQGRLRGKRVTVERAVNEVLREYAFIKDTKTILV